jgi:WD40 repeat protein
MAGSSLSAVLGYDDSAFSDDDVIDSAVAVWDVATPDRLALISKPLLAFAVALSPDGRLLYVATRDPALKVIEVSSGQIVNSIPLSAITTLWPTPADLDDSFQTVWDALFGGMEISPDGKTLAVVEGKDIVIYDAATLTVRNQLREHDDLIRSLEFSHDGRLLVSGSADHTAVVWDLATGRVVLKLVGHSDAVMALAFSPDDSTLYTGGMDKHVLVWDVTGRRRFVARSVYGIPRAILGGVSIPSPDGNAVVYVGPGTTSGKVRLLDVSTGQLGEPVVDRDGVALAAWLGPDNERVVTVADRSLRVRSRGSAQLIKDRVVISGKISAIAGTPDGRYVVVGDDTGSLQRVDADTLSAAGPRVHLSSRVAAIAAGPADSAVALLDDKTYVVVDLVSGEELRRGDLTVKPATAALSADGGRLAVGGAGGEVGLLDLQSQQWIALPQVAHHQTVGGVAFSADGQTLVTSSFDSGVRLWNGFTGEPIAGVQVGQDPSAAVATVSPDGTAAIVATRDGAVYRLDTRFDSGRPSPARWEPATSPPRNGWPFSVTSLTGKLVQREVGPPRDNGPIC